jgi:Ca2+-binding EF-hand superfamily protein
MSMISSPLSLVTRALLVSLPILAAAGTAARRASAEDAGPTPATARAYARLLDRFDANHDGLVQTSELPVSLQPRLGAADVDHDGVISPDELHRYGVARRAARFARADRNGDGQLDPAEVGAIRWEYLKIADTDADGRLTLDEIEGAVGSGKLRGMSAEEVFLLLDRNGDGVIDLKRASERERALLAPADTNHDANVTLDELKAYRVAVGRD